MTDIPTRLEVRRQRRDDAKKHGPIYRALSDAWLEYQRMRREGVSREDCNRGLEAVLRDVYPQQRERPWVVYCDECQDTGIRRLDADPATHYMGETRQVGCVCPKGRARLSSSQEPEDVAAQVAKSWGGVDTRRRGY